ncbi:uncharacterized protein LOC128239964 [Mya arenaria]|uniref:uncharacterized protein LOC128239964 n=1 Tax=Mya arenaria TaxID=6604 RepID=UPI0022E88870|nr:uncharacterized protein LOC128239964 [Mya arenaria]
MERLVVLLATAGLALGANTACLTVDEIVDAIYMSADTDMDGILSMQEFSVTLQNDWGIAPGGAGLTISEFTNLWVTNYHDSHSTAHDFAVNLDINNDKHITDVDMNTYVGIYDANMDGQFTKEEFLTFMHAVHPDPHNSGGQAHGCH